MKFSIFILPIFLFSNFLCAEELAAPTKDTNAAQLHPNSFWSQIGQELATPLTTKANLILAGSTVAATMVYINKGRRAYDKRESFSDAQPLKNYGFIGEAVGWGYLNGLYVAGHIGHGLYYHDQESVKGAEHMFKASLYTLMATGSMKLVIKERRPGYPEDRGSFPSGHSSMSFAFASVVAARNGWAWGSLAYSAATYISVSRINDDWHYLHDVLFGMGIGASYGWGLAYAYEEGLPFQFALVPMPKLGLSGIIAWDF
jgi:membrane-associated phospholipid phosphatase